MLEVLEVGGVLEVLEAAGFAAAGAAFGLRPRFAFGLAAWRAAEVGRYQSFRSFGVASRCAAKNS